MIFSSGVYFILPTLLVLVSSFLVVRAGAIALMMTGLDEQTARFQALSAFTLTGYTTSEAELVVNHPKRREIVSWLMRLGSAGVIIVIVTATTSLIRSRGFDIPISLLLLVGGGLVAYRVMNLTWFVNRWETFIRYQLLKAGLFHLEPMETLARLWSGVALVRVYISSDSNLVGATIAECDLLDQQAIVLGIERRHQWVPLPGVDEKLMDGDRLLIFGRLTDLRAFAGASHPGYIPRNLAH